MQRHFHIVSKIKCSVVQTAVKTPNVLAQNGRVCGLTCTNPEEHLCVPGDWRRVDSRMGTCFLVLKAVFWRFWPKQWHAKVSVELHASAPRCHRWSADTEIHESSLRRRREGGGRPTTRKPWHTNEYLRVYHFTCVVSTATRPLGVTRWNIALWLARLGLPAEPNGTSAALWWLLSRQQVPSGRGQAAVYPTRCHIVLTLALMSAEEPVFR